MDDLQALTMDQIRIVRKRIAREEWTPAYVLVGPFPVSVCVVMDRPDLGQRCVVVRDEDGKRSQPILYSQLLVNADTAQRLQA